MKRQVSDKDVLKLLAELKSAEKSYPSGMHQARRDSYVKQVAVMAVVLRTTGGGTISSGNGSARPAFLGRFLETVLVIMIMVEAGVAAYIYRDRITDFITSTFFPNVEQVVNPPQGSTSAPAVIPITGEELGTATPTINPTATFSPTATVTSTVTGPPEPSIAPNAMEGIVTSDNVTVEGDLEIQSTPIPGDNSGLHLGQTPMHERTLPSNKGNPSNEDKSSKKDDPP